MTIDIRRELQRQRELDTDCGISTFVEREEQRGQMLAELLVDHVDALERSSETWHIGPYVVLVQGPGMVARAVPEEECPGGDPTENASSAAAPG